MTPKQQQQQQRKSSPSSLVVMALDALIEGAIRSHSGRCWIAEAIKNAARQIGWRIGRVRVDEATMRFTDIEAGKRYIFFTPAHVLAAIRLFDGGIKPVPFSFVLRRGDAAQIVDSARCQNWPSRKARRSIKVVTREQHKGTKATNPNARRVRSVTVIGGKPLPLMPRQTTRLFGSCGVTKELLTLMGANFTQMPPAQQPA